jgi:hypothetical protein
MANLVHEAIRAAVFRGRCTIGCAASRGPSRFFHLYSKSLRAASGRASRVPPRWTFLLNLGLAEPRYGMFDCVVLHPAEQSPAAMRDAGVGAWGAGG